MLSAPVQTLSRTVQEQIGNRPAVRMDRRMNKGTRQPTLPLRAQLWQLPVCRDESTVMAGYRALKGRVGGRRAARPVGTADAVGDESLACRA